MCERILGSVKKCLILKSETKQQTSLYKGVCWNKETGKWRAYLSFKRQIQKYGGCYSNEMDAAKRVNQLCQEMKIPLRNSGITGMPNEVTQFFLS